MSLFDNQRFTIVTISVLVILNLVLIGIIVGPKLVKTDHNRRNIDRRSAYMADKLGFSDNQREKYDSLNANHRQETRTLQKNIDEKRQMMFRLSQSSAISFEQADSLSDEIGGLVSDMELRTYEHISNIRALCSPQQLVKLDSLVQQMIKRRRSNQRDINEPHIRR